MCEWALRWCLCVEMCLLCFDIQRSSLDISNNVRGGRANNHQRSACRSVTDNQHSSDTSEYSIFVGVGSDNVYNYFEYCGLCSLANRCVLLLLLSLLFELNTILLPLFLHILTTTYHHDLVSIVWPILYIIIIVWRRTCS